MGRLRMLARVMKEVERVALRRRMAVRYFTSSC